MPLPEKIPNVFKEAPFDAESFEGEQRRRKATNDDCGRGLTIVLPIAVFVLFLILLVQDLSLPPSVVEKVVAMQIPTAPLTRIKVESDYPIATFGQPQDTYPTVCNKAASGGPTGSILNPAGVDADGTVPLCYGVPSANDNAGVMVGVALPTTAGVHTITLLRLHENPTADPVPLTMSANCTAVTGGYCKATDANWVYELVYKAWQPNKCVTTVTSAPMIACELEYLGVQLGYSATETVSSVSSVPSETVFERASTMWLNRPKSTVPEAEGGMPFPGRRVAASPPPVRMDMGNGQTSVLPITGAPTVESSTTDASTAFWIQDSSTTAPSTGTYGNFYRWPGGTGSYDLCSKSPGNANVPLSSQATTCPSVASCDCTSTRVQLFKGDRVGVPVFMHSLPSKFRSEVSSSSRGFLSVLGTTGGYISIVMALFGGAAKLYRKFHNTKAGAGGRSGPSKAAATTTEMTTNPAATV